jgi:hypothetical protein
MNWEEKHTTSHFLDDFYYSGYSWMGMVHYCEKLMGVVVFAKGQGQSKV